MPSFIQYHNVKWTSVLQQDISSWYNHIKEREVKIMGNSKTSWIRCKNTSNKGTIALYLLTGGKEYFLCDQKFRQSSWNFFKNGVIYKKAMDYSRAHNDSSIINIMKRIRLCIDYLEKYERVSLPERNKTVCEI